MQSDQISCSVVSDSLRPHETQNARPPCPSPTPGVHWDSRPSSQWCHPAISWVFFLLWLHPFILSGVISPLISSSRLGTYWPGEFFFQYPIILPSDTVHGVLRARILKWFAIPFSSGPQSVRPLHHDPKYPILRCLSFPALPFFGRNFNKDHDRCSPLTPALSAPN